MKHTVSRIALACIALLNVMASHAANTDPFDFDYEISGGIAERPALIFNDGSKTYIQPRAGQVITASGGHAEGPYIVVDGTPESVSYTVAGRTATARWTRANTFIGGGARGALAALRDDQPPAFDGFTNRLVLIGSHGALEPVRSLKASMPVANTVKALVPQGWTGSAQKDVDLTEAAAFSTRQGENWMQALDRLMTQSGLYADVDFTTRHIRLHREAPKSGHSTTPLVRRRNLTRLRRPLLHERTQQNRTRHRPALRCWPTTSVHRRSATVTTRTPRSGFHRNPLTN